MTGQQSQDPSIVDDSFEPLMQMEESTPSTFNQTPNIETAALTPVRTSSRAPTQPQPAQTSTQPPAGNGLDFTALDLVCPINSDDIKNRWLNSYVPLPGQTPKEPPPSVHNFIYRMLKSYASKAIRGRAPPFIHPMQTSLAPLSTCFTLVRMCNPLPVSGSVAADILQREMARLYEERETCDAIRLLGVFQAYLIYSMVLFFHLGPSMPFLRTAMINLQELACLTCRQGLACVAEQQGIRPKWEAWILAEAKRRTLYTMYFLDNVLSAHDGLPIYLATELRGVYLPSSKTLWQADRVEWERSYNSYLVECAGEPFRIDELWLFEDGMSEDDIARQRGRVDRWLEDVDEFGTMLYAAASCTHGG
ncbi:hypothetical protein F53441_10116 [Fusarium austroafricanum]|uniref:Transcription factor domain-containing protein n=1 Tax=Fusarium austroafricanum TaxID=2364996 RepID=A0A8H4KA93_9HYPO|nr:hypothetical protein F53441_10116 [Fusarium austroafricanum]